ncbi:nuclear transport factor 2 family protein [Streptomyces sp. NPDC090306]|uniref:nuclear transport factor 2 family protein n=1 Tax=unclassified Streptomyces TaxID=2593676 RepID=UPI0036EBE9C0
MSARSSTTVPPVISTFYERVDTGDVDAICALFAADAVYARPGYPELRSRAAIAHFYRHDRVIASGRHTIDQSVVDWGTGHSLVAVRGSFEGVSRDGRPIAHRFAEFFRIGTDGLFTERETFFAVAHV